MPRGGLAGLLGLGLALVAGSTVSAATLQRVGAGDYVTPTYVTSDPRDPERLFVTEQEGRIRVTAGDDTFVYMDLRDKVLASGERGLWSMAFAPDFAQTGLFYVTYAADEPGTANHGALTLDEFRDRGTPTATEGTRRLVLSIPNDPGTSIHNGGQLQFGPDGYLYWSTGEDGNRPLAQQTDTLLGKILRIDPRQSGPNPYTVPADNPFVDTASDPEIWSFGLRNPWRFSFDRATGAIAIADVGLGTWEEVDYATPAQGGGRGANYGWPNCEAIQDLMGSCADPGFTGPLYAYQHQPSDCAITGGYVVRDPDLGDLYGRYLFADYCGSELRSIDPAAPPAPDADHREGLKVANPVSFGEDACGRIYVASQGEGQIFRLQGPANGACPGAPPNRDTDPPQTKVKLKPRNDRRSRLVAKLRSDEPGSTFKCRLDKRKWKRCSKKRKLKGMDPGRHRFRARAIDPAGNKDKSPAKRRFKTTR